MQLALHRVAYAAPGYAGLHFVSVPKPCKPVASKVLGTAGKARTLTIPAWFDAFIAEID
jgi:hypothetical protein